MIFDTYAAAFCLMLVVVIELILVCYVYGVKNYMSDLRTMMGKPTTKLGKWFGPTGYYPAFAW